MTSIINDIQIIFWFAKFFAIVFIASMALFFGYIFAVIAIDTIKTKAVARRKKKVAEFYRQHNGLIGNFKKQK